MRSIYLSIPLLMVGVAAGAQEIQQSTGFVPMPREEYDALPEPGSPLGLSTETTSFDLSKDFPIPGSQGTWLSCTAWASSYIKSFYEFREVDPKPASAPKYSPYFLYGALQYQNSCGGGIQPNAAFSFMENKGIVTWSELTDVDFKCEKPNPGLYLSALKNKTSNHGRAYDNPRKLTPFIQSGHPILIGMYVDPTFRGWRNKSEGEVIQDFVGAKESDSLHAVVAVGFDNQKEAIKILNSWGPSWGAGGFGWVSYKYLDTAIDQTFMMGNRQDNEMIPGFFDTIFGSRRIAQARISSPDSLCVESGFGEVVCANTPENMFPRLWKFQNDASRFDKSIASMLNKYGYPNSDSAVSKFYENLSNAILKQYSAFVAEEDGVEYLISAGPFYKRVEDDCLPFAFSKNRDPIGDFAICKSKESTLELLWQ